MNKTFTIISVAEAFSALSQNNGKPVGGFGFRSCADALYTDALLAGARAQAEDASPYRFLDDSGRWWSSCARITVESPIAKGHNPQSLTEEQVGVSEGWRLLTAEEHSPHRSVKDVHCMFGPRASSGDGEWFTGRQALRTKHPEGFYLPKAKIAEGFNPHSLTVDQVGVGFRLLTAEEIGSESRNFRNTYWWRTGGWSDLGTWAAGSSSTVTLRTQKPAGYFLPKVPQYVPWTFETAPKGCVLVRGKNIGAIQFVQIIMAWKDRGAQLQHGGGWNSYDELLRLYEFSVDGKTWAPAGSKVDV